MREAEDIRHEHRAPVTLFSLAALLQLHCSAGFFPHEHLAWAAQAQDPFWDGLQQVEAGTGAISGGLDLEYVCR